MQQESQRFHFLHDPRKPEHFHSVSHCSTWSGSSWRTPPIISFFAFVFLLPANIHPSSVSNTSFHQRTFNHSLLWFMLSNICVLFVKCQHETVNVLTSSGLGCFSASLNKNIFISRHYSVWLCVIFGFGGLFALTSRSAVTDVSDLVWTGSCDLCVTSLFSFSDIRL